MLLVKVSEQLTVDVLCTCLCCAFCPLLPLLFVHVVLSLQHLK